MKKISLTDLVIVGGVPVVSTNYQFNADFLDVLSIQVAWTSTTAAFAYIIQTSNDNVNWTDLGASQAIANNNGSTHTQIKMVKDAAYYRIALTKTSGALTTFNILVASLPR